MAKQIAFDIIARDKASKTFGKIGGAARLLGVAGLGAVVTNAVQTEAQFSKTMNVMQATSGASGKEMDKLRGLAVKMGADTKFSAGAAAEAMLELARGGIKPAQIQAGALAGTLTLAAAGELEMGEAANIAVKAMGQFGLKGKDMGKIAAALAGGANASSASVRDMSIALAQSGLAANSVGFSIQETTAVLAAFSNAGLEGSDAGTSMKTMLDRLQPATKGARSAMIQLGAYSLKTGSAFVKANGEFKSAAQIAEILHKGTAKLSAAERKRLITQAFGSDAQRAATIFAKEGARGLKRLTKATSDQGAAEKQAAANMKGTGGALEKMSGSLETASLAIGQMVAPAVVFLADKVGMLANEFVAFTPRIQATAKFVKDNQTTFAALAATIVALVVVTKIHTAAMAVQAAGGLLPLLKATKLVSSVTKTYTAVMWALNAAMSANPVGLIIVAIAALVAGLIIAYKKSDTFRRIVDKAFRAVQVAAAFAFNWIRNNWKLLLAIITGPIGLAVLVITKHWGSIKNGAQGVVTFVKGIPGKLRDLGAKFGDAGTFLIKQFVNGLSNAGQFVSNIVGHVIDAVKGAINAALAAIESSISFKIDWPGPGSYSFNPSIPRLAKGGIVRARPGGTAVIAGEAGHDEAVVPLSGPNAPRITGGGGGGVTINFNGLVGDPKAAAREIRKVLLELKRTSGLDLGLA